MSLHSLLPQQIEVLLQLFHWSVLHFRSTPALMVVAVPAMVHVGVMLLHASGMPLGEEVALVWRERGAKAETAPLARFLSKQLASMRSPR